MADILGPQLADAEKFANAKITCEAVFMDYLEQDTVPPDESMEAAVWETDSDGAAKEYLFTSDLPEFEQWKDERRMAELGAAKITIANDNFANGVTIHRNEISDNRWSDIERRIQGLAMKAAQHRRKLVTRLLLNGFSGTAYPETGDGTCYTTKLFFANDHSMFGGSQTVDNLSTLAFSEANYEALCIQMAGFTNWQDDNPLELNPTHLIVGPSNEFAAKRLVGQINLGQTSGTGGGTNIHYGTRRVIVNRRLVGAYANYWFLGAFGEAYKPIIFQKREPITTASQADWSSPDAFKKGKLNFGAQARYGVGYFDPRLMIGSTGAG